MAKGKIEVNHRVVGQILNGDAIEADLMRRLRAIKDAFPDEGLEISTQKGRTRIQASAMTTSRRAALLESRSRALSRAASAASGSSGKP